MITLMTRKKLFLILFVVFVTVMAVLGYKKYKLNNTQCKDYKSQAIFGMENNRFLFVKDGLTATQSMMLQDSVLAKGYYPTYSKYEFSYFAKILDWFYGDYVAKSEPVRVLDVGCAYGTFLYFIRQTLPSAELYCVDFMDLYFSKDLGKKKSINYAISNIEVKDIPFPGKFDVIILTEVLEHFNYNPVSTLKKLNEALQDNGTIYLSTPDSSSSWGVTTKYYKSFDAIPNVESCMIDGKCTNIDDHVWQYNLPELISAINSGGLEAQRLDYTFSQPYYRHFNLVLKKKVRQQ